MTTEDKPRGATLVRMRRETFALFDQLHRQINEQLPQGVAMSKVAVLDLCVSSTSALAAAGQLQLGKRSKEGAA